MLIIILAFILGVVTDFVWAKYMQSVTVHKAFSAANWSILIYVCGIYYTLLVVEHNIAAILAYLVGGWIGMYCSVKYFKPK